MKRITITIAINTTTIITVITATITIIIIIIIIWPVFMIHFHFTTSPRHLRGNAIRTIESICFDFTIDTFIVVVTDFLDIPNLLVSLHYSKEESTC